MNDGGTGLCPNVVPSPCPSSPRSRCNFGPVSIAVIATVVRLGPCEFCIVDFAGRVLVHGTVVDFAGRTGPCEFMHHGTVIDIYCRVGPSEFILDIAGRVLVLSSCPVLLFKSCAKWME